MRGSDIVIVVAGMGRKPGMTRMDLLRTNADIVKNVALKIATYAKDSKIIIVTNPLDPMTYLALKITGFSKNNVMGMGGMLDLSRFKNFIQDVTKISSQSIQALVIGEHGENMLPLIRFSSIGGIPLTQVISKEQAQDIFDHTKKVAAEVIALKGATIFAPGNAVTTMVEAIIKNKRSVIPVSTLLEGEYGASNLCIGVPTIIGSNGVEKIIELELDTIEQNIFNQGITSLRDVINALPI
jgi:malate dehydrogenase